MKKYVSQIIVVILILNCVGTPRYAADYNYDKTRPVPVSQRVGESIDKEEQVKYGLFPSVPDFKSAVFYRIYEAGYKPGYVVEIETETLKLIAVNRDPNAFKTLRDYIDRYEEIKENRSAFEEKWGIVTYDELGQPITENEISGARGPSNACLYGLGCGVVGFIPVCFLAMLSSNPWSGEPDRRSAWLAFLGGMVICVGAGAVIGHSMEVSSRDIIKIILKSREVRVVERF